MSLKDLEMSLLSWQVHMFVTKYLLPTCSPKRLQQRPLLPATSLWFQHMMLLFSRQKDSIIGCGGLAWQLWGH